MQLVDIPKQIQYPQSFNDLVGMRLVLGDKISALGRLQYVRDDDYNLVRDENGNVVIDEVIHALLTDLLQEDKRLSAMISALRDS